MTMPSWVQRRSLVDIVAASCVIALAVTGCVAKQPHETKGPPSTVQHPPPPLPKDRDEWAVLAALARIDPCAVLESAGVGTLQASSPSTCQAANPGGGKVAFRVDRLPTARRLKLPSRTLAGAKVYVDAPADCTVWLPVSFELAVAIDVRDAPASVDRCTGAQTIATAAANALADPVAVQADIRWEACAALRSAPGTDVAPPDMMDRCLDQHSKAVLEFKYSTPGMSDWQRTTVSGVVVWTRDDPDPKAPSCHAEWSFGPAARHARNGMQLVASLGAVDCGRVTPLVEPLITALRKPPPQVEPQRPLLYRPDEPDSSQPGACAYAALPQTGAPLPMAANCAPYVQVPVPAEAGEIARAAEADANVHCAVALDAIVKHLGTEMRPVTVSSTCHFVQPERLIRVEFAVSSATVQDISKSGLPGAEQIEMARHPGYRLPRRDNRADYEIWVATSTSPSRPGSLHLTLGTGPVATQPLLADTAAKVEPILADILRKYFT